MAVIAGFCIHLTRSVKLNHGQTDRFLFASPVIQQSPNNKGETAVCGSFIFDCWKTGVGDLRLSQIGLQTGSIVWTWPGWHIIQEPLPLTAFCGWYMDVVCHILDNSSKESIKQLNNQSTSWYYPRFSRGCTMQVVCCYTSH